MLTSELSRFNIEGGAIKPAFILRKDAQEYVKVAEDIIRIFKNNIGKRRFELENSLEKYESDKIDYKIYRGFAKIIEGLCVFESATTLDCEQVRTLVFDLAQLEGPVVKNPDLLHKATRSHIIKKAAEKLKIEDEEIEKALFGDFKSNYVLKNIKGLITSSIIIKRYNLALAQAILYQALDMKVKAYSDFKTVFKYIGLSGLLHTIKPAGKGYFIEINGPLSIFRRTQKYGIRFSRFLAGLVMAQNWEMSSRINTRFGIKILKLSSKSGLKSFYSPEKIFDSSFEQKFYIKFLKTKKEWVIKRESEVIDLGGIILVPDFVFYHETGEKVFFEIIGFWTPEYLTKKLEKMKKIKNEHLIIAINRNLNCSKNELKTHFNNVIFFTTGIKVKDILNLLNSIYS